MRGEPVRGGVPDAGFSSLSGLEQAQAQRRGLIPRSPLEHLTGMSLTQVRPGSVTVRMPASPWLQMGEEGTLDFLVPAEAALSLAVLTAAPPASDLRLAALSVTQFRPWTLDSESLIVGAHIVSSGGTFTFAEAVLEDGLGRSIAHAAGTAAVEPMDPPPPAAPPFGRIEPPRYPSPDPYLRPLSGAGPVPREDWERLTGFDIARMMGTGERLQFPASVLLGIRFETVEPGHMVWSMPASEWFCSRSRAVAPGVLAAASHWTLISTLLTLSPGGQRIAIVGFSLNFLQSAPADGHPLLFDATVTEHHRDLLVASVAVTGSGGRLATGHETARFVPPHRRSGPAVTPVLATVVFTDIVGSTARATELGDDRWGVVRADHDDIVRRALRRYGGREVKGTGDGFLVTFSTPADAVAFARAVRSDVRPLGLAVRVGAHTGQCDEVDGDVTGLAVHLAARVLAAADPDEVLVTSTVRDLLLGTGVRFDDRGRHKLKGLEGEWQLFALAEHDQ